MKIILTTLNSKFIHSNLAIRYLSTYTRDLHDVEIYEYTINQNIDLIVSELYDTGADVIGFSTYIWNLNETIEVCETLKLIKPDLKILLGGPEVSFDPVNAMEKYPFVDFILYGEGEETFREFVKATIENYSYENIDGLVYRNNGAIIKNNPRELMKDLNIIPSPYEVVGKDLENKIIYYESARGCPFNCAFCLSSTIKGVRYFDIERVKRDLGNLIDGKVRQVKFVDRTFNTNKEYAKEIMNFIMDKNPENINFHFEVTAHILDDDMLEFLKTAKEGLFQFEVGVQTTNEKTIRSINRTTDFERLSYVTRKIESYKTIHQHLDLIAGLPYEDYESFGRSFNDVYNLKPEKLQLGFLKLLKGSPLREEEEIHGFKYIDRPPYEILENNYISYKDISRLKGIEDLVEKYYNEEYFKNTLDYIIVKHYSGPFEFYEDFLDYWNFKDYSKVSHSRNSLYLILKAFMSTKDYSDMMVIDNLIKYDYIYNHSKTRLPFELKLKDQKDPEYNIHDVLKSEKLLKGPIKEYENKTTRKVMNLVTIDIFDFDVIEFIDSRYEMDLAREDVYILFKHKDGEIKRAKTYNITDIIKELI